MKSLAKNEKVVLGVTHKTSFTYSEPVSQSQNELRMSPVDTGLQRVLRHEISVDPNVNLRDYTDHFGNKVVYFNLLEPHTHLTITATSEVETTNEFSCGIEANPDPRPFADRLVEFLGWTKGVPHLDQYGEIPVAEGFASTLSEADFKTALQEIASYFYQTYTYKADVTNVYSTPQDLFANKAGVCQDMAHALIGVLRYHGVPARYVSGYVLDSQDQGADLRGVGATHAWVHAWHEDSGWIGVDPTNNKLVDWQYVRTATGRDYFDVQPVRGVFQGTTEQQMSVAVEVKIIK